MGANKDLSLIYPQHQFANTSGDFGGTSMDFSEMGSNHSGYWSWRLGSSRDFHAISGLENGCSNKEDWNTTNQSYYYHY